MTAEPRSDGVIPRRYLTPFLLLSLQYDGPSYGYQLCERVRAQGLTVDLAGVYRSLRSLHRRDLVSAEWEPSGNGPDRRVYSLTSGGRIEAHAASHELSALKDALTDALQSFAVAPQARR